MPRTVKVTYSDGSTTVFQNVPDNVTSGQVARRASTPGKNIVTIDGGRNAQPQPTPIPTTPQPRPQPATAPAPAPIAQPLNWFQRVVQAASTGAGDLMGPNNPIGATLRGIQNEIPGIDHVSALANEAGTALGVNQSNMSYGDRVRAFQQAREAVANQDAHGASLPNAIQHYVGEGAGIIGSGLGMGRIATGAVARIVPAAEKIAAASPGMVKFADAAENALQKITPQVVKNVGTQLGRAAASPIGKIVAGGAGAGAATGALNSSRMSDVAGNAGEGAAAGAIAAPVFAGGVKLAAVLAHPIMDAFGASSAANILRRYVSMTAEQFQQAAADWKARTGANPTVFELLPLADRQKVQGMLGIMPGVSKERAATLIQQRAGNIGQEISDKAQAVIAPQRQAIVDKISNDLAQSRGDSAPTPADIALANQAARDPAALNTARQTINSNIMAPHDPTQVAERVSDLVPQEPVLQKDGSVANVETDPDMSNLIRNAAGVQNLDQSGVTVSDVTSMISKLRRVANSSPDFIQASTASRAADHLADQLPDAAAEAHSAMTDSSTHYKQMLEGWKAGLQGNLRENVDPTGNFQMVENQYDTPGGAQGRTLGQASAIDQQLSLSPSQNLRAASDIANNPTTQEAITRNVGGPTVDADGNPIAGAGQQIADAAQAQTDSARNLASVNPETPAQGVDLPGLASSLIKLNPASMPSTKAYAVSQIMRMGARLPEAQSNQLVDALFSQNPTKIDAGIKFLNNAGDAGRAALASMQQAMTVGGFAGNAGTATPPQDPNAPDGEHLVGQGVNADGSTYPQYGTATPDPSVAAADPNSAPADPNAPPAAPQQPTPVDPSQSPYMAALNEVYQKGDPRLLSLANTLQSRESSDMQFNKDGTVKVSPKGAVGLMQIMPTSLPTIAANAGLPADVVALHNDPAYNKLMGVHYVDQLMQKYSGDRQKVAAAYNAGPTAVDQAIAKDPTGWLTHLPSETQQYAGDIQ